MRTEVRKPKLLAATLFDGMVFFSLSKGNKAQGKMVEKHPEERKRGQRLGKSGACGKVEAGMWVMLAASKTRGRGICL